MAGYSGTPLAKKLGIKEGHRVAAIRGPGNLEELLDDLPAGVEFVRKESAKTLADAKSPPVTPLHDVIVVFCVTAAELEDDLASSSAALTMAGGLWIAWPKRTSGIATDLTENLLRDIILPTGLVDNKVCAIDETWSGLRFVRRVKDRV